MSTLREAAVEDHLVKLAKAAKGFCRKLKWIGRRGAPDRFLTLPAPHPRRGMWLVELKRPGGVLEEHQAREHKRLREAGVNVVVLDSIEAIDRFMKGEG